MSEQTKIVIESVACTLVLAGVAVTCIVAPFVILGGH
jgi:hypothetical protein